ncbi:hypothetical protein IT408_01055 [Candidatus Uhrbacteria bacterium]|nr:hypothetical protein [Candidatus Uhrbacteria bacterium]
MMKSFWMRFCAMCFVFIFPINSVHAALWYEKFYPGLAPYSYDGWTIYNPSYYPTNSGLPYEVVDETTCNGSDFVYSSTPGSASSFGVSTTTELEALRKVHMIDITPCAASKLALSNATFQVFYIINGVNSGLSAMYTVSGSTFKVLPPYTFKNLSIPAGSIHSLEVGILKGNSQLVKLGNIHIRLFTSAP